MIAYNRHNWTSQVFAFQGTVLRRVSSRVALVALITLILSIIKIASEPETLAMIPALKDFGWIDKAYGRGVTTRGSGFSEM